MNRIFDDKSDADGGSQMENSIALFDKRFHKFNITDVAFDKLEAGVVFEALNIFETAGAQIIDDNYIIVVIEQPFGQMRPDKTRPACY
jgi:hypothetical protein